MAGSDKRLEVMEDELKLLKGEVKRTLVDIRAFMMREDSPLNERMSSGPAPSAKPPVQTEVIVKDKDEGRRMESLEDELKYLRREGGGGGSSAQSDKALEVLQEGMKSQSGDKVLEVLADELKSQRQERSDITSGVQAPAQSPVPQPPTEAAGNVAPEPPAASQPPATAPQEPATATAQQPQPSSQDHPAARVDQQYDTRVEQSQQPRPESQPPWEEATRDEAMPDRSPHGREGEWQDREGRPPRGGGRRYRQPRGYEEGASPDFAERRRYVPMKETPRPHERKTNGNGNGNGHRWDREDLEEYYWDSSYPGDPYGDGATSPDFLDVNLTGNLVRWTLQAKRRMGQERLMDLLELYFRSGHHSKELKEIIGYICTVSEEDEGEYGPDPAQECVDLIHQLHGILTGGIRVINRPWVKNGNGERAVTDGMYDRGA